MHLNLALLNLFKESLTLKKLENEIRFTLLNTMMIGTLLKLANVKSHSTQQANLISSFEIATLKKLKFLKMIKLMGNHVAKT